MRIAQVIASLNPDMGGLPKSAVSLSATLAASGEEVGLFFQAAPDQMPQIDAAYEGLPGYDKIQKIALPPEKIAYLCPLALQDALRAFSPEMLHTHGLWEPMLIQAQRYALKSDIPFGLCAHSMLHPWQARHYVAAKWTLKNLLGWKKVWKKAAFVQVLNAEESAPWHALGITQTRLIPNGIFPEEDLGASDLDLPTLAGKPFVLSLARLHAQKSPDLLLEAFSRVADRDKDLHLVLAGPDDGMRAELMQQTQQAGLETRVHFPGPLSGKQKWAALHQCACFCLPSRAEGFSLALLEASLAGAPSVISEACYFPTLIDAGGALLAPLEAAGLADALRQVLDAPGDMGKKAQALVLGRYQWTVIADQLQAVYQEVLT